ncbi:sn-glycerol-3-phosphate ABC transporter ATP-binding protein UgpC [Clostridium sp. D2Q-11]|uniref:Sn-glycerol-3-phosphate ABC transporter ATP-binding protein UgpC n=1 Tax=Anaeromonas frigoriresistens TaxID=2683708 RepID=A0A942UQN3_9FIRM|nr:sn-glycerol-3-phosphate ABC transporter ATP-binding protein UgpC [Anaeromonas frigoriresistens]MBS4537423.1 sn-glycerol-3-phosphate ABC transporter ATP-binding protein UgpC [Anaeromonas frigoriresistens]
MAGLTFKNIEKIYPGNVKAVDDFNLEIKDKEFIVLVGPSGCGKSTTLRMVAGLEEISNGELYIGEKLVNDIPPKNRDIAMVFQNYALYPHMTVYDNMAFGLKLRKTPKNEIDEKVKEAAQILGIENLLERKPKALSGGQRQRVALGRAIVRNPKVFLMDEPLSNLDAKLRVQTRTEISKLHKKLQTTFIYVTHDQTEAMTMGDRIVIMKDGIIQQADTPQNVYEHPSNVFVAGFIGSPQMNFFEGEIEATDIDNCYLLLENSNIKVKLPEGRAKLLKEGNHFGKPVIMGIRPEDIHDEKIFVESSKDSSFEAIVDVTEMMGSETYLYLNIFGKNAIARVDARNKAKAGDTAKLAFDKNRIHLFDKESEETIF